MVQSKNSSRPSRCRRYYGRREPQDGLCSLLAHVCGWRTRVSYRAQKTRTERTGVVFHGSSDHHRYGPKEPISSRDSGSKGSKQEKGQGGF
ncbi:unnamed protein product [Spodoptera exigua]|nr:unnamed protein product [Spodoptera exigua]